MQISSFVRICDVDDTSGQSLGRSHIAMHACLKTFRICDECQNLTSWRILTKFISVPITILQIFRFSTNSVGSQVAKCQIIPKMKRH